MIEPRIESWYDTEHGVSYVRVALPDTWMARQTWLRTRLLWWYVRLLSKHLWLTRRRALR